MSRFHGILVIDKPAGWTSHDVVGWTRRWLGQKKVGHAGTLDPAATGVLPVVVGDATRFVEYLAEAGKSYLADITFGVETDSADVDGVVVVRRDATHVTAGMVEAALDAFRGDITQRPPMHSAIKVGGRRLYELARRGEEIDVPIRAVTISRLELCRYEGNTATLVVDCSKGTYIRALARDLGAVLDVGAHLSNLVRLETGPFSIEEAWTVAELGEHDPAEVWSLVAHTADAPLDDHFALVLNDEEARDWCDGKVVPWPGDGAAAVVRAYGADGRFLGVGRPHRDGGGWQPTKVVHDAA